MSQVLFDAGMMRFPVAELKRLALSHLARAAARAGSVVRALAAPRPARPPADPAERRNARTSGDAFDIDFPFLAVMLTLYGMLAPQECPGPGRRQPTRAALFLFLPTIGDRPRLPVEI